MAYRTPAAHAYNRPTQSRSAVPARPQRPPVPHPMIVTSDVLAEMPDGELHARWRALKDAHTSARTARYPTFLWDVELAYVKRELGIRDGRRETAARERGVQHQDDMDWAAAEALVESNLPEFEPTPPPREWFRVSPHGRSA